MNVALVAAKDYPDLGPDDAALFEPMRAHGMTPQIVVWDDPAVDWPSFAACVLRSPWDYFLRPAEFAAWLDVREADGTNLWNPAGVVRWNMNKRYLESIEASGIHAVPTAWLGHGTAASLAAVLEERGWDRAVVKPGISAGAHRTYVVTRDDVAAHQSEADDLLAGGDVMVQPFLREFVDEGEWSLLFFGDEFSHAVVKRPADGDFRVQERHGGSTVPAVAGDALVAQAREVLAAAPGDLLYARVDGVWSGGRFLLVELEVFEPVLYLAHDPGAAARFAGALAKRLR